MPNFILQYGLFKFDPGEAAISISRSSQFDQKGERTRERETWTITGTLVENSAAAFTIKIKALTDAFAADGLDLILFEGNGTTKTAHELIQEDTLSGVKVETIEFPEGENAEYATVRNYRIVVSAEFESISILAADPDILSFSESLTFWGGGARVEWQETIQSTPKKFQVAEFTLFRAIQRGTAVGRNKYPTVPAPLFGSDKLLLPNPRIEKQNPVRERFLPGDIFKGFAISWEYEYLSGQNILTPTVDSPGTWL